MRWAFCRSRQTISSRRWPARPRRHGSLRRGRQGPQTAISVVWICYARRKTTGVSTLGAISPQLQETNSLIKPNMTNLKRVSQSTMGIEPTISRFVGGRLIHWATRTLCRYYDNTSTVHSNLLYITPRTVHSAGLRFRMNDAKPTANHFKLRKC